MAEAGYLMGEFWAVGKSFLAGFRRHFGYLLPAVFILPFEIYERILRTNFLDNTWPEHLVLPASAFPWVLLGTGLWTAFLTYRDLYEQNRGSPHLVGAATSSSRGGRPPGAHPAAPPPWPQP